MIYTTYVAIGNVASTTPPSRPAHIFAYTPMDLEAAYTSPDLRIGTVATTYNPTSRKLLTSIPEAKNILNRQDAKAAKGG
ncbi:MAG TPA: hypothetical protein VLM91_00315 [Candidatus Methylomirabilis sp.]|nr:hypothetical protein [Candidatus Methylomirabilis sp.]